MVSAFSELRTFADSTVHEPMTYNSKTNYTPGLTSQDGHSSGQDSGSLSFRSLSFRTDDEQGNEQIADGAKCCEINHQSNVPGGGR